MTATFYVGDAIEVMGKLPEQSVDLILTSPPFLALRSYLPADHPDKDLEGGSQATPGEFIDWLVDVVEACDRVLAPHGSLCIELGDTYAGSGGAGGDYNADGLRAGQEKFSGSATGRRRGGSIERSALVALGLMTDNNKAGSGWPLAKSLSLIPELFRLTLVYGTNPLTGRQTERWRLRNVVRWVRPNPPVGALGDKFRPATSELMVFCKSAKRYFDLDAVREPYAQPWRIGKTEDNGRGAEYPDDVRGAWSNKPNFTREDRGGAPPLDWWNIEQVSNLRQPCEHNRYDEHFIYGSARPTYWGDLCPGGEFITTSGAPLDWWNIPPGGYQGSHYAVFPAELCIKPIKAMSPERVCNVCGEPSRRTSEAGVAKLSGAVLREAREAAGLTRAEVGAWWGGGANNVWDYEEGGHVPPRDRWDQLKAGLKIGNEHDYLIPEAVEYEYVNNDSGGLTQDVNGNLYRRVTSRQNRIAPDRFTDCGHDDWRPGLVLDCFAGSGTTLLVATGHGRDAIGIDLDERNFDLALERVGPLVLTGPFRLDEAPTEPQPPELPANVQTPVDVPSGEPL